MGRRTYCHLTREGWRKLTESLLAKALESTELAYSARLNVQAISEETGLNRRTVQKIVEYREEISGCACSSLAALCNLCEYQLREADVDCPPEARAQCTAPRQLQEEVSANGSDAPRESPLASTKNGKSWPSLYTSFIPRPQESQISNLLASYRLITLTGTGGVGKTRLAIEVARNLGSTYSDGMVFVDLTSTQDPTQIPWEVARQLAVAEKSGTSLLDNLIRILGTKTVLLILDNCEHIIDGSARFASLLLQQCPNLRIIATSREPLRVAGEHIYPIPPLSVPPATDWPYKINSKNLGLTPENLWTYESVQLFVERSQRAKSDFTITKKNAPMLAAICRQLEGIPLAIELTAALKGGMSLEAIYTGLGNPLKLLTEGFRDEHIRHQTLHNVIDWSYGLLSHQERVLLQRLSVFAGGWTPEAAQAVCHFGEIHEQDMPKLLQALTNKSLLIFVERDEHVRFSMLHMIRAYAAERLDESDEAQQVQQHHRAYFLSLVEETQSQWEGPEQETWLQRLEREHDNLRVALKSWEATQNGAEPGLRMAAGLWRLWYVLGHR